MNDENSTIESPSQNNTNNEWTPSRISAVILLIALCGVLVWNAYHPEDVFFSDLKYEVMQSERFEPQKDTSVEGNTITMLQGETPIFYPRGLGVHANTEIQLRFLPNGYRFFEAEVGIDRETPEGAPSSVIFTVESDGTILYESPVMRRGMAPRFVRVCLDGRNSITLRAADAGDGNEGDRADWAMARFTAR